jgi:prepilin-type processing-associated H-X9-DG protein
MPFRSIVKILIVLLVIVLTAGIGVGLIQKVRSEAARIDCSSNMRQIFLAIGAYHDVYKHFPPGTVAFADLPPEKRFSWLAEIFPYIEAGPRMLLDREKAWDTPANCPPRWNVFDSTDGIVLVADRATGDLPVFLCPANPARGEPNMPGVTHYVGIAGLGVSAAELPIEDAKAGFFGYDRIITFDDLKHGQATTIMVAETLQPGLWTAGGPNTVRGLVAEQQTYFGTGGQFGSGHVSCTNVGFADGSVRALTAAMSPRIIEAMTALAGDPNIARFED